MKAFAIKQFGEPSCFEEIELVKPTIKPGHVIIKVMATSVNPVDTKIRKGAYPSMAAPFPCVLHGDVSGIIEEISEDVKNFKVGDEVFGCAGGIIGSDGALAEYMRADAKLLAKKPRSLNMVEAAALPLVCITAWEALFEKIKIKPKQKVLVHAGTGGVGHVGIQLARWAGADVYATVSSDEKASIVKSLGAIDAINYRSETVQDYVQRVTAGHGFDIVFDTVGGENLNQSMNAVVLYGNIVTIQANSTNDLRPLHGKSASLHAVLMLIPLIYNIQRERHGKIMEKIAELVDEGKLKPLIDSQVFSFADIDKAHARLESGQAIGKVVVKR